MSEEQKAVEKLDKERHNYKLKSEDLHYLNVLYYMIINYKKELNIKKCLICGLEFKAKRKNQKCCSEICKKKNALLYSKQYSKNLTNEQKEKRKEKIKKYQKDNKSKIRKYKKEYAEKNKEKIAEYQKNWRKTHKEHIKNIRKNMKKQGGTNEIFYSSNISGNTNTYIGLYNK